MLALREPGGNRLDNIVSHLLMQLNKFKCFSTWWGGQLTRVISVSLKTCRFFRLLRIGLLEQAEVLLSSQMVFFPRSVQERQSNGLL